MSCNGVAKMFQGVEKQGNSKRGVSKGSKNVIRQNKIVILF